MKNNDIELKCDNTNVSSKILKTYDAKEIEMR